MSIHDAQTNPIKTVAEAIGIFYLQKNKSDYHLAACEIVELRITKLEVERDHIIITTKRPGRLIGKKGENIKLLSKFFDGHHIQIKEDMDPLEKWLIPRDPMEDIYDNYTR